VYNAWNWHSPLFAHWVGGFAKGYDGLVNMWDDLTADRAIGILRVNQVEEVRGDRQGQLMGSKEAACPFLRR